MEVILLKEHDSLGEIGDIVNVKINQTSGISLQGDIVTSQEMEIA